MSQLKFDIVLYSSPFFESLVSEFYRISRYKRNIYKKIRNEEEFAKKLSNEERTILKDLSEKENRILIEILANKQWLVKQQFEDCAYDRYELNPEKFELLNSYDDPKKLQQDIKDL
ncbi:MAG: hypothetical protein AB1394_11575 [Bacteroidota bacterium]